MEKKKNHNRTIWTCAGFLAVLAVATTAVAGTSLYGYTQKSDCEISLYDGELTHALAVGTKKTSETTTQSEVKPQNEATPQTQTSTVTPGSIVAPQTSTAPQSQNQTVTPQVQSAEQQTTPVQQTKEQTKPDSPYFHVEDDKQIWNTETSVDIFQKSYSGQDGNVTVKSGDSEKVIAPGTDGSYTFTLKNTGKKGADYKVWIETSISSGLRKASLQTRMTGKDGWLLGGSDSWTPLAELDGAAEESHLEAGKSAAYTISWQWPYEQDEDSLDTSLGNLTDEQNLTCRVTIHTVATGDTGHHHSGTSEEEKDAGTIAKNPLLLGSVQTGDENHLILWLVIAAAAAGVVLFLVFRRKERKEEDTDDRAQ